MGPKKQTRRGREVKMLTIDDDLIEKTTYPNAMVYTFNGGQTIKIESEDTIQLESDPYDISFFENTENVADRLKKLECYKKKNKPLFYVKGNAEK